MNIAELRELIEYATPAPWSVVPPSGARVYPAVRGELRLVGSVHSEHNRPRANADAALIVAAVNALGPLLDLVTAAKQVDAALPPNWIDMHAQGPAIRALRAALAKLAAWFAIVIIAFLILLPLMSFVWLAKELERGGRS